MLTHPQLGPLLARTLDAAGEQALVQRAERTGCDVRTLERAAVAWTPHGTVYLGSGPLDGARIASLLWERLLAPRRRTTDAQHDERVEGMLVRHAVGLGVRSACGLVGFEEHEDARVLDRLWRESTMRDPSELLVWHTSQVPPDVVHGAPTLMQQVSQLDVAVALSADGGGVDVRVRLEGAFDAAARGRVQAALTALVESPLGEVTGASTWLTPEDSQGMTASPTEIVRRVEVPWRALAALADALRGDLRDTIVD